MRRAAIAALTLALVAERDGGGGEGGVPDVRVVGVILHPGLQDEADCIQRAVVARVLYAAAREERKLFCHAVFYDACRHTYYVVCLPGEGQALSGMIGIGDGGCRERTEQRCRKQQATMNHPENSPLRAVGGQCFFMVCVDWHTILRLLFKIMTVLLRFAKLYKIAKITPPDTLKNVML